MLAGVPDTPLARTNNRPIIFCSLKRILEQKNRKSSNSVSFFNTAVIKNFPRFLRETPITEFLLSITAYLQSATFLKTNSITSVSGGILSRIFQNRYILEFFWATASDCMIPTIYKALKIPYLQQDFLYRHPLKNSAKILINKTTTSSEDIYYKHVDEVALNF